jgi:hypothetical protein
MKISDLTWPGEMTDEDMSIFAKERELVGYKISCADYLMEGFIRQWRIFNAGTDNVYYMREGGAWVRQPDNYGFLADIMNGILAESKKKAGL